MDNIDIIEVVSPFICSNILADVETGNLDMFLQEFINTIEEENCEIKQMIKKVFLDSVNLEKQARVSAVL